MSDDPNTDIARRLRAEGQAQAPADLRSEVMAQVAAEPRRRRARQRRLWRPVLAAAAVACALGGAAIGASNLGGSSQSTGLATRAAAEADLGSKSVGPSIAERVYTISAGDARKLLHSSAAAPSVGDTTGTAKNPTVVVRLPAKGAAAYVARLRNAQARWQAAKNDDAGSPDSVRVVVTPPARTAGTGGN